MTSAVPAFGRVLLLVCAWSLWSCSTGRESAFEADGLATRGAVVKVDAPSGDVYAGPTGERYTVWLSRRETTVGEFVEFCRETGTALPPQPSGSSSDFPVVGVTWGEAMAYCAWTGGRLPRYGEWREAIGLTEGLIGGHWVTQRGLIVDEGNDINLERSHGPVRPVGSNPADVSDSGAQDLWGNACEWLLDNAGNEDWASGGPSVKALAAIVAPRSTFILARRSISYIDPVDRDTRSPVIGFRVCYDTRRSDCLRGDLPGK